MRLGFTGTRKGLTRWQRMALLELIQEADEVHHGDCVGADEECHHLAAAEGKRIVIHPPDNPRLRAFCDGENVVILEPKPYLERNRNIVMSTDATVGCPKEDSEPFPTSGQGTWSCIRYARKHDRLKRIIWPDETPRM